MTNSAKDAAEIAARLHRLSGLTDNQIASLSLTLDPVQVDQVSDSVLALLANGTLPGLPVNPDGGLPLGLPGAVQPSRFVGATVSGPPTTGTFAVGDFVIVRSGGISVCTTAGSPGTWQTPGTGIFAVPGQLTNRNRPRKLVPSFQGFRRIGTVLKNDATWKDQYAGIGMDVVFDPDAQHWTMIYCGSHVAGTTTFGFAYSDDGETWVDGGSNPVFGANGTGGQPDSGGVTFPQLVRHNGLWYLYYIGFPNPGYEQGTTKLCYATTPSLTSPTWTRHGAIITPSSFPGGSGVTVVYRPTVFQVGSIWYLFTNAGPAAGVEDIWYFTATSPDGPWTVGAKVVNGTSFNTGASGTIASDPEIVRFGDWFVLLCWGQDGLHYAYCDASEFPTTWHATDVALPLAGAGGAQRPVWVDGPAGPLLFINAQGSTCVDLYVPSTSPLGRGAAKTRLNTAGRYYRAAGASTLTTSVAGDGFVTLHEFAADTAITVTSLSVNVTASSTGVIRLGVYADDGTGMPGARLLDAGTVPVTSTGTKTISGLTLRLKAGRYWIACAAQGGSPTLTSVATGAFPAATSAFVADLFTTWFGWYGSGYTGAFPATATGIAVAANPIPMTVIGT